MLVPALTVLPTGLWVALFVGLATWFLWGAARWVVRRGVGDVNRDLHPVSHYLTHLVMSCAMLYMYLAPDAGGGVHLGSMSIAGASGATANYVGLPLFFLIVLSTSAIAHVDRLSRFSPRQPALAGRAGPSPGEGQVERVTFERGTATAGGRSGPVTRPAPGVSGRDDLAFLAPRLEMLCHIAMCITMGYMLVLML